MGVVAFEGFLPLFLFNQPPHIGYNAVSRGRAVLSAHLMRLCRDHFRKTVSVKTLFWSAVTECFSGGMGKRLPAEICH